jgi:hypothetical protein
MQSSEDRKALKPILAGHTELPLDLDEFKNLWNRLESVADSMGLFDMVLSSTAPEIVADPLKADIAESLYYEGVFAQGSGINQADRGTINPFDALRLSVARSDAELGRYIGLFVTSETQTLLGLGIEYLDIGKNYKIKVKDARKKWENKQPLLDTDLALLRLPVERYQYVLKKKEFKKLGAFGLDELLQKVNIQVLKNGQADLRNGSSEHAISHAQYAELMMLYARGYVKSNFADALSYKPWERIDSLLQEKKRVFNAVGEIHTCVVKSGSTVVEINAMLLRKKADLTPLYLDRLFVKDALKETQQYLQTNKINENFTYIGFQITSPEVLLCIYDPNKNPNSLNPRGSGDPARPAEYFHVLQDLRPE